LEDTPIVERNGEWFHESYDELSHTNSKKHDYLITPWSCGGGLLLDFFSTHKPHSKFPPTRLVHYKTYKPLSNLCFLKVKVYFTVTSNHIFVQIFARWILITPTLRVASTQTEIIITFSSYYLVMDYTFYVTPLMLENCNWDHYFIMIANMNFKEYDAIH
jgi:hypothetical protein